MRNSLTLITTALKNFPKMFLTKEEQKKIFKEVYAYKAINENLLDARVEREGFWVTYKQMEISRTPPSDHEDLDRTATEPLAEADISQNTVYVRDDSHVSAEKRPRDETEGDTVVWNGDEDTLPVLEEKMLKLE